MIIKYPNKILSTPSSDVTVEEGQLVTKQLKEEIKNVSWGQVAGMAAPQIGINKNVFVCMGKIYFNPKIVWSSNEKETYKEGCYSLKENKFDYEVIRAKSIKVEYMDYLGKQKTNFYTGLQAQIFQHEYDHLLGKTCNGK